MKKLFVFLCILTMVLGVAGTAGAVPTAGTYGLNDSFWQEIYYGGGAHQSGNKLVFQDVTDFYYLYDGLQMTDSTIVEDNILNGTGTQVWETSYTGLLGFSGEIWESGDPFYYGGSVEASVTSTEYYQDYGFSDMEFELEIFSTIDSKVIFDGAFNIIYFESIAGPDFYFTAQGDFEGSDTGYIYGDLTEVELTVVPEPASMLLLGSGLIGLAGIRRKKKK